MSIAWRRERAIPALRWPLKLLSAPEAALKPGSRRRSVACFWIMPIRRRCQKHDNSFQGISKPQLWLEPDGDTQSDVETASSVAIHLMPDSIRAHYWRAAVAWVILFCIVPSICPQYSLPASAALSGQSATATHEAAASELEGANTLTEFQCGKLSFDRSSTCIRSGGAVYDHAHPSTNRTEVLHQTHEILRSEISPAVGSAIGYVKKTMKALTPGVRVFIAMAGFLIILFIGPAFIYLRCRRPICDQIEQLIPDYLIGYVRHTPHYISLGGEIRHAAERLWAFFLHMTFDYLTFRDGQEPVNWRNIPSTQGKMIDLAILSFIARAFAIRQFQWPLYACAFFFGPAVITYFLLWALSTLEVYKPLYLGAAALIWGIFAIANVLTVMGKISMVTNPSDGGTPMRIPTAVKDRHDQLIDLLRNNPLRYVRIASSVIFSVMLVLLLTQIDLTQNH